MQKINVAKDFTRFPSGRYKKNGDTSGEAFREKFLEGPVTKKEPVTIELDGTIGYGSSFLEEAFGGLVRKLQPSRNDLQPLLTLVSEDSSLIDEINGYIDDALNALK
jgi:hypothetical protein